MGNGKWFRRGGGRANGGEQKSGGKAKRKSWLASTTSRCALSFESLEDRRMLATFLVTNTNDIVDNATSFGSLRWAVERTNAMDDSDTIVFSQSILSTGEAQSFINLNGGALTITQPVRILGPGARKLEISQGTGNSRVFDLNIGDETTIGSVEISGVTISSGGVSGMDDAGKGGGIFNRESLTMTEVIISNNTAAAGGGGVYTPFGSLTLSRSLVVDNFGGGPLDTGEGGGGGAILNGRKEIENRPTTTIINSTFTRNEGGAVVNRNGNTTVRHSTLTENDYGIVSWGNPLPEEEGGEPPPETVFTRVYSSIAFGNETADVERVGETDDEEPKPLAPSIKSLGFNIIGVGNVTAGEDATYFAGDDPDQIGVDPLFAIDEVTMDPLGLMDFGGSTDVFLLQPTSPAIDKGGVPVGGQFDQRGRHFTREFGYLDPMDPITDVGAAEMQFGQFVVDTLVDETDGVYNKIYELKFVAGQPQFTIFSYETLGDFSLREAIQFSEKNPGGPTTNPGRDTITFSTTLNSQKILEEEDLTDSPAPTITLALGTALLLTEEVDIVGPEGFILEIDAVGNDTNPLVQNGTGTQVFIINDGITAQFSDFSISNLTIMGGDFIGRGAGISTREDLTLTRVTLKNNNATDDGGGLHAFGGATVLVDRTTLRNNRAGDNGAGISSLGANLTLRNSTLSANVAGNRGGGLLVDGGTAVVKFSTITQNTASSTVGSGILAQGTMPSVTVQSSIVSGNTSKDVDFFGSGNSAANFTSGGWNFVGRGGALSAFTNNDVTFTTSGALATDPKLEPIANTGGLIETHQPIYRPDLGVISPVIDRGNPAPFPGAPTTDQRGPGFVRVFNGLGVGAARIDIGAYELQGSTFLVSTLGDDNDGVVSSGNLSLREAIQLANQNPLPDTIEFDPTLFALFEQPRITFGDTLVPGTPADLRITSSMIINWTLDTTLTIDAGGLDNPSLTIDGSRMFTVDDGNLAQRSDVQFRGNAGGLRFLNGRAPEGGSVFYSRENLSFSDVTFQNNVTIETNEAAFGFPPVDQTGLHGGALFQDGTGQAVRPTLTLDRVLMTGNLTIDQDADGGAVYVLNAAMVMNDSTIAGNSTTLASSDGGAIALKNGTLVSNFSTITGNATLAGSADGGGLYFSDASVVTLNDTVVSGNRTAGPNSEGGGVAGDASQLAVNRSVVSENFSIGSQSSGGGIALTGGSATIDLSSVRSNFVSGSNTHGGGVWNNGGVLTVRGSTIAGNQATSVQSKGGGVYTDTNLAGTQSTLILNSTVSGNFAALRGGGVFNADGRTEIKHSTIANNSTGSIGSGSGLASFGNAGTTQTSVQSSIIAGNVGADLGTRTDVDFVDAGVSNSVTSLGYNIIGVGNATSVFTQPGDKKGVLDPGLAPLADNGAPAGVVYELLTHSLLATSFAVNGGSPTFNANSFSPALLLDQHGVSRVQMGRIDVGAYESNFATPAIADFDNDADVDGADFLTWQRNLGRTGATLAQGDANADGLVNSQDLTAFRNTFGIGSSGATGSAVAASGGAMFGAEAMQSAADSEQALSTPLTNFASLASLGVPASAAQPTETAKPSRPRNSSSLAAVDSPAVVADRWDESTHDSALSSEDDDESLLADDGDADDAVHDAVFAAWEGVRVGRAF